MIVADVEEDAGRLVVWLAVGRHRLTAAVGRPGILAEFAVDGTAGIDSLVESPVRAADYMSFGQAMATGQIQMQVELVMEA